MSLFYGGTVASSYRSLVVVTASGTGDRPVSVADAKEHLRIVDTTEDDAYVGQLVDAATT